MATPAASIRSPLLAAGLAALLLQAAWAYEGKSMHKSEQKAMSVRADGTVEDADAGRQRFASEVADQDPEEGVFRRAVVQTPAQLQSLQRGHQFYVLNNMCLADSLSKCGNNSWGGYKMKNDKGQWVLEPWECPRCFWTTLFFKQTCEGEARKTELVADIVQDVPGFVKAASGRFQTLCCKKYTCSVKEDYISSEGVRVPTIAEVNDWAGSSDFVQKCYEEDFKKNEATMIGCWAPLLKLANIVVSPWQGGALTEKATDDMILSWCSAETRSPFRSPNCRLALCKKLSIAHPDLYGMYWCPKEVESDSFFSTLLKAAVEKQRPGALALDSSRSIHCCCRYSIGNIGGSCANGDEKGRRCCKYTSSEGSSGFSCSSTSKTLSEDALPFLCHA